MFSRILVAVDGSEPAGWAVEVGASMAECAGNPGARVSLVCVADAADESAAGAGAGFGPMPLRALQREGRRVLREAAGRVPAALLDKVLLREGRAADEILAAARQLGSDVIVMGTHGRGRLTPLLIGATADATARQAPCPVLVVARPPPSAAPGTQAGRQAMATRLEQVAMG